MKRYDDDNILKIIKAAAMHSSQKQVSENLGISQQFLCDVLKRRRPITDRVLAAMGFKRVWYIVEDKK